MSTDTNIDAIFDLAADSTTSTTSAETPTAPANTPQSADTDTSPANPALVYHNVLRTLTATEAGEGNPEGTYTIAEFAGHLSVEAIKAGGGIDALVKDANIYSAVKAKNALPVVLVFADDADQSDHRNVSKVYLPIVEALKAWENRPARGEGSGAAASKRDHESLLTGLAKKTTALGDIVTRRLRAQEQEAKATKTVEKYHGWIAQYYANAVPVEVTVTDENGAEVTRLQTQAEASAAALRADVEKRIDEIAAEEDKAKDSDIPDATPTA